VVALAGSSLVLAVASRFIKVSFHVFGWAGMLVLMAVLSTSGNGNFIFLIVSTLLVTALVASSRLSLKAHSHKEVYLGFFLGLICNIAVYLIFDGRL
jgi:membrane-associated phospholipid phosphatase